MHVPEALGIVLFLAGVIVYALLCRWIGDFARSKGYSYWAFALFSFAVTPIWGLALACVVADRAGRGVPVQQKPTA